jgi:hypothetical protein
MPALLFPSRALRLQRGEPANFIGLVRQGFFPVTRGPRRRASPDTTVSAFAASGSGHFHAILPHVLQQQINGTDANRQQDEGNEDGKHDSGSEMAGATTISYRLIGVSCGPTPKDGQRSAEPALCPAKRLIDDKD